METVHSSKMLVKVYLTTKTVSSKFFIVLQDSINQQFVVDKMILAKIVSVIISQILLTFLSPLPEMFNRPAQQTHNYKFGPVLGFHIGIEHVRTQNKNFFSL
jgi:hypothetical protein